MPRAQRIRLQEYAPHRMSRAEMPPEAMDVLRRDYAKQVSIVIEPGLLGGDECVLTSLGYVGYIPITDDLHIELAPKLPLENLFGMLEVAFELGEFERGRTACDTLQEVYERLAGVLAKRVLERARLGLYREYVPRHARLAMVRGRIDTTRLARAPWQADLDCRKRITPPMWSRTRS